MPADSENGDFGIPGSLEFSEGFRIGFVEGGHEILPQVFPGDLSDGLERNPEGLGEALPVVQMGDFDGGEFTGEDMELIYLPLFEPHVTKALSEAEVASRFGDKLDQFESGDLPSVSQLVGKPSVGRSEGR